MRNLYIIFILLLGSANAQVMQWSNPTKLKGSAIFTKVIGENEHGVFLLRYRNKFFSKNVIIDKYHHQLNLNSSKTIDLKRSRLVKIKLTEYGILVIKSFFSRSEQSNVLYGQYYDFDLKPIGKAVRMLSTEIQDFGDKGNFRVRISENQQYIAIIHSIKAENHQLQMFWSIFDRNFNQLREKTAVMPISNKDFFIADFVVSDSGTMVCLAREIVEVDRRDRKFVNRVFVQEKDSLFDFSLSDSLWLQELNMVYDRIANEVLITSFYGREELYGSKGLMVFRYSFQTRKSRAIYTTFGAELVKELNLGKYESDVIPEGFEFLKVVPRSDGGLLCVAEQKEIATESDIIMVNGIPTSTSKNIYNFNDILVLNVNAQGSVEWSHVIHKNQTTVNDGGYFSSAVVFVSDNFIQLIYNDQIRSSGEVMQYTLYSNGKMMSRKLLKSELDYVVVIPLESTQVSSNKIIIPTSKNRRFALLKLIYD